MGRVPAAAVGVVLVLVGLVIAAGGPASAQGTCAQFDVSGTWLTHQSNNYDTTLAFTQSGTALSGTATVPGDQAARAGYTGSGSIRGAIDGDRLVVTVTWPKAGGASVAGRYTATVAATDDTRGKLTGGDAGGLAWTGSGPARCVKRADETAKLGEVARPVPAPGGSVTATSSGSIAPTARKLASSVTSSSGNLEDTTVVASAKASRNSNAVGEAVAACWLIGPDALPGGTALNAAALARIAKEMERLDAQQRLIACMALVSVLNQEFGMGAGSAATGCRATRLELTTRRDRRGHVTSVRVRRRAAAKRDVRYSCTVRAPGSIGIAADGRRSGGLRSLVGKKLGLGVVRARSAAPDSGRLTFRFGV